MTALVKLVRTTAFKLALGLLAAFAVTATLSLGYVLWQSGRIIQQQIAASVATEIVSLRQSYSGAGLLGLLRQVEDRSARTNGFIYLVSAPTGEPLVGNVVSLPPGVIDRTGETETDYTRRSSAGEARGTAYVRVLVLPSGFRLLVGQDIAERRRFAEVLARAIIGGLVLVVVLGLAGGLFVARQVLVRIDALTDTSRDIMAGDLSRRLPVSGSGDEFDRLAVAVNAMLERITGLMDGLRQVSDDVAHDLKTPLTRIRSGAEEALRNGRETADHRAALEKVLEESDQLISTFNSMLLIARAESGNARDVMKKVDAADILAGVAELYEPVAEDAGFTFSAKVSGPAMIHGNRELLAQSVSNLIDNAIKYGRGGEGGAINKIELSLEQDDHSVKLVVADRGPGIPADDRVRVLERFVRLETSRSQPGSGLGLSLVNAVAHLHGGTLTLADDQPGLRAVISLPKTAA
ncbi:sensor histidine kinase [Terrihabitans rhizophilus]|uniref:histidine kinase n=1 Tax=Terrihabitans rhizophilus TaxID=3092662 RepID=A0ABU4RP13_9HYPH|nr:ATP-binding protein [Terrihabitans sp. PJ23]MDX6806584.1 ATP-binding protein [Terrihabitans sp. PJ23]